MTRLALITIALALLWPAPLGAANPPSFKYIAGSFRAQLFVDDRLAAENARLRVKLSKARRANTFHAEIVRRLKRTLLARDDVREAIELAATVYGVSFSTLWRKAGCETGGAYNENARNRTAIGREHASGLFQFLPSTFHSTPFAGFSIWSMYPNALAAGWMHSAAVGRAGEWACR